MLKTLAETVVLIGSGKLLHIAAGEKLLRLLPKGNWIGGTTEYFIQESGGLVTGDLLDVIEYNYTSYSITAYEAESIDNMRYDAYPNGFSMIIIPFGCGVMKNFANNSTKSKDAFLTPVVGWVSAYGASGSSPAIAVNGQTGEIYTDKAIALHVSLPDDKTVVVNIINVFKPDENSPVVRFLEDGFTVRKCLVDGEETDFSELLKSKSFNRSLPIVGDYSGENINVTVRNIGVGEVSLYAPVFKGIDYRFASEPDDYAGQLKSLISAINTENTVFSCYCYLSFKYGRLEGKDVGGLYGPVTFGEVAYMLVNHTMVYMQVI